jgi:Ni/Fe-hydrogenase 1 B-type cytochrome subunit
MAHETAEHPVEMRIYHWLHLIGMITLGVSGFYIHSPFFPNGMRWMRFAHFVAMYVVLVVLVLRVSYAFLSRNRDFHSFGLGLKQWKLIPGVLGYYLFLKKKLPEGVGAYNPMQRLTYIFFALLLIPQAITGFSMYSSTAPYFTWFVTFMGGLAKVRALHLFIMWVFLAVGLAHVYLSLFEDFAQFKYMILSVEPKELKK